MCEPHHSIIQFPPEDLGGPPAAGQTISILGRILDFGKRIRGWYNFSKMGKGHTEGAGFKGLSRRCDDSILYEASWWNREVRRDGGIPRRLLLQVCPESIIDQAVVYADYIQSRQLQDQYSAELAKESLDAASDYANHVSTGSLHALRSFLELSMKSTDRPQFYLRDFRQILTKGGLHAYEAKLKQIVNMKIIYEMLGHGYNRVFDDPNIRRSVTKLMLGFTRKRGLLVPAWADDSALWLPASSKG